MRKKGKMLCWALLSEIRYKSHVNHGKHNKQISRAERFTQLKLNIRNESLNLSLQLLLKPWSQIPLRTAANAVRTIFGPFSYGLLKAAVRESSVRRTFRKFVAMQVDGLVQDFYEHLKKTSLRKAAVRRS